MNILFIDHSFHKKTKSSNFFLELIRKHFDTVFVEYVDVESHSQISALTAPRDYDLVIIWQLDFLAPAFLAAGYPTVVVPMYDGSANQPNEHWLSMNKASFICFSRTLHERVIAAGARSHLVKYYLPPCEESQLPKFDDLKGALWMRRPQDGLTPKLIEKLLGQQLNTLHVHNAPDIGEPCLLSSPDFHVSSFPVTESRWSGSSNHYLAAIKRSNVFIAPRMSEGIGMAMLEALANGLLVIANDDAVHNEYIANWVNGILFNRDVASGFSLSVKDAKDLAYGGWFGAKIGYQKWKESCPLTIEFIKNTPIAPGISGPFSHKLVEALWDAYLLGGGYYRHFLREHLLNLCANRDEKKVTPTFLNSFKEDAGEIPVVDSDGLFFGSTPRSVAKKFGFNHYDAFTAQLSSLSCGFAVKINDINGVYKRSVVSIRCQPDIDFWGAWLVLVYVNNELISKPKETREENALLIDAHIPGATVLDIKLSFIPKSLDLENAQIPSIRFISVHLKDVVKK